MNALRRFCTSIALLGLVVVYGPASAWGQQKLYVAPGGSDSNPGTIKQPLQTLSAAVGMAQDSAAIYVLPGTYSVPEGLSISQNAVSILAFSDTRPLLQYDASAGAMFAVSGDSVRIDGLILDGKFVSGGR